MADSAKDPLLILGGGLIGLSIAYELAVKGRKVQVLSRKRTEAAGFVAAGMLAPHAEGLEDNLLELGQLSLNRIPGWVKTIEGHSGMKCGLRHCGIVVPFLDDQQRDAYPTALFGEKLNRAELEAEIPGIGSKWQTALLFQQDGQIDNRRQLMHALELSCLQLGVSIQEGVEVKRLLHNGINLQGVEIKNAHGGMEKRLIKNAVICCGAWSQEVLNEIPIFPIKGQMLSIKGPKNALKRIIFGPGTYLVPREDGLIVIGATSEKDAFFQKGLTSKGQKQLEKGTHELLPPTKDWPCIERWWGFRPCTPDNLPIIGNSRIDGLWLATGHYRNGVLLAAITANIITKLIYNEQLNVEEKKLLQTFSIERFEIQ